MSRLSSPVLLSLLWIALSACGDNDQPAEPEEPTPRLTTIEVSPDSVELSEPGDTARFKATARDQNGAAMSGVTFTWSSSDSAVATVDSEGLVTAREEGRSEITASSGGVTGRSVAAVRFSPTPGTKWSATFGEAGGEVMEGVWIADDGSYVLAGLSDSYSEDGGEDAWVVKMDPTGQVEWTKTYGGSGTDMVTDVKQTPDGGHIVVGFTSSFGAGQADFWVLKLDSEGAIEWEKSYGGGSEEQAWSVDLNSEGGYVVAGGTTSFGAGGSDYWVLKLDAGGDIVWQKTYGGTADDAGGGAFGEFVARVIEDRAGDYVVASWTTSFGHGDADIWVLKLDPADGSIVWQFAYGDQDEDSMWTFAEAVGRGYLVTGSGTFGDDTDLWILRLNEDGTVRWQKTYGVVGIFDEALAAAATADGGAILGGFFEASATDWTATLLRVGPEGTLSWAKQYKTGDQDWVNAVRELSDGGHVAVSVTVEDSETSSEDLWVKSVDSDGAIGSSCEFVSPLELSVAETTTSPLATDATGQDTGVSPVATSAVLGEPVPSSRLLCSE